MLRRSLLLGIGGILASAAAPAIVTRPMKIVVPSKDIVIAESARLYPHQQQAMARIYRRGYINKSSFIYLGTLYQNEFKEDANRVQVESLKVELHTGRFVA